MGKIKIGDNEYQPPFRELDDEEINEVWVMDAGNNYVKVDSVIDALNELAQLRQCKESDLPFLVWAQSYIDPARWAGHRLDDAVKTELLERDTRLAQLRQERDALKARVEELGLAVKAYKEKHQGCHTMEFSPCATCDFIDAVQEWVDDTKNTTPGGDDGK